MRVAVAGFDLGEVSRIDFSGTGMAGTSNGHTLSVSSSGFDRFAVTNLDAKTTGATLIGTTRASGEKFYPLFIVARVRTADTIAVVATASVGTNATDYNNIIAATVLTNLSTVDKFLRWDVTLATSNVAASTGIYFKVTIGATATTMAIDVHVAGYYQ